jgi:hypothetical protein
MRTTSAGLAIRERRMDGLAIYRGFSEHTRRWRKWTPLAGGRAFGKLAIGRTVQQTKL